ncbi:clathrin heavy chain linker domain-containing protein 1, partial [Tachyglossus aculeatus]|uniref:clathrin heavy chain linker domain-containing protein 1 n=1 Tax=Tachyglossus aculeatus TaxID=9261 RepID=UPI0018F363A4
LTSALSEMSSQVSRINKHFVLPPIICDSDRKFLESMQRYIITEMDKVGCTEEGPAEEYFIIYKTVFDKIIEYVSAYKNILTSVKKEYDAVIDTLKQNQRTAFCLHGKLKAFAAEPTTLIYHRKRAVQLAMKIRIIEKNSMKIQHEIIKKELRRKNTIREIKSSKKDINPSQPIPGLSWQESFNLDSLTEYLRRLEKKYADLEFSITRYIPAQRKASLDEEVIRALSRRDAAEALNVRLKFRYKRMLATEKALRDWDPAGGISLLDYITQALEDESYFQDDQEDDDAAHLIEDDPSKAREAEDLLDYIERFHELFSQGQYEVAALFAINSPRGILRNIEIMNIFKGVGKPKGEVLPLLLFFEALFSTSRAVKRPVDAVLTLEGIKCALSEKRLDLVIHWVTQQRLTFSEETGDVIYNYEAHNLYNRAKCLALAQIVYSECAVPRKAALCMCKQGQIYGAVKYIQQVQNFSLDDFIFLIKNCPSIELVKCLTQGRNGKQGALSFGLVILILLSSELKKLGFQVLLEVSAGGKSSLEEIMLRDTVCMVEGWKEIADACLANGHPKLSQEILSVLVAQEGVIEILPDDDATNLMEHVLW